MSLSPAKEWRYNMGGVNVVFETATCGLALVSSPRYTGFTDTASPDLTLHLTNGAPLMPFGAPTFEAGHWDYYCHDAVDIFRMRIASPGPHFTIYTAVLQADGHRGELYLEDENPVSGEQYSYEIPPLALDEVLATHWITRHGGLILHACGLASTNGGGLLFSGHSGAGKSTTARLWLQSGQAQLLSDERIRIFREEEFYHIQGTPWHGEGLTPSRATVPLNVYSLSRMHPKTKPNSCTQRKRCRHCSAALCCLSGTKKA